MPASLPAFGFFISPKLLVREGKKEEVFRIVTFRRHGHGLAQLENRAFVIARSVERDAARVEKSGFFRIQRCGPLG